MPSWVGGGGLNGWSGGGERLRSAFGAPRPRSRAIGPGRQSNHPGGWVTPLLTDDSVRGVVEFPSISVRRCAPGIRGWAKFGSVALCSEVLPAGEPVA